MKIIQSCVEFAPSIQIKSAIKTAGLVSAAAEELDRIGV